MNKPILPKNLEIKASVNKIPLGFIIFLTQLPVFENLMCARQYAKSFPDMVSFHVHEVSLAQ